MFDSTHEYGVPFFATTAEIDGDDALEGQLLAMTVVAAEAFLPAGTRYEVRMVRRSDGIGIAWYYSPMFPNEPFWNERAFTDPARWLEAFDPVSETFILVRAVTRGGLFVG